MLLRTRVPLQLCAFSPHDMYGVTPASAAWQRCRGTANACFTCRSKMPRLIRRPPCVPRSVAGVLVAAVLLYVFLGYGGPDSRPGRRPLPNTGSSTAMQDGYTSPGTASALGTGALAYDDEQDAAGGAELPPPHVFREAEMGEGEDSDTESGVSVMERQDPPEDPKPPDQRPGQRLGPMGHDKLTHLQSSAELQPEIVSLNLDHGVISDTFDDGNVPSNQNASTAVPGAGASSSADASLDGDSPIAVHAVNEPAALQPACPARTGCLNSGVCHATPGDPPGFECRCAAAFSGDRCEIPITVSTVVDSNRTIHATQSAGRASGWRDWAKSAGMFTWANTSICRHSMQAYSRCLGVPSSVAGSSPASRAQCATDSSTGQDNRTTSSPHTDSIAVVIVATDRPSYFKLVAGSVRNQTAYEYMDVFVFVDFKANTDNLKVKQLAREILPRAVVREMITNVGIARLTLMATQETFDAVGDDGKHKYDQLVFLEDDHLISYNYVEAMRTMLSFADAMPMVSIVYGNFMNFPENDDFVHRPGRKLFRMTRDGVCEFQLSRHYEVLDLNSHNMWAWGLSRSKFERMNDTYHRGIVETGLDVVPYARRDYGRIRDFYDRTCPGEATWIRRWAGQDWLRACAFAANGMTYKLAPLKRMMSYIGAKGIHMLANTFEQSGFNPVQFPAELTYSIQHLKEKLCSNTCVLGRPRAFSQQALNTDREKK